MSNRISWLRSRASSSKVSVKTSDGCGLRMDGKVNEMTDAELASLALRQEKHVKVKEPKAVTLDGNTIQQTHELTPHALANFFRVANVAPVEDAADGDEPGAETGAVDGDGATVPDVNGRARRGRRS